MKQSGDPYRLGVVFGTRPEAIKLYPLLVALAPYVEQGAVSLRTISTGQQPDLLEQSLDLLGIQPDYALSVGAGGSNLATLHARMTESLTTVFHDEPLDFLFVQGDTLTAFSAALAAFYARIPVHHVEAGLRTWDPNHPFPEEVHRRWITHVTHTHYCPTVQAQRNLIQEGVPASCAILVGNTVIDAMRLVNNRIAYPTELPAPVGRRIFFTSHRRENLDRLEGHILPAIRSVVTQNPDVDVVVSVHPNPVVEQAMQRYLQGHERIHLMRPLDYTEALGLVRDSTLVVTDSGGLQEEATAMGTPVLVLRRVTERIEAVDAGCALVIGTDAQSMSERICGVLNDAALLAQMAQPSRVFGDGYAAERIVAHVLGESR